MTGLHFSQAGKLLGWAREIRGNRRLQLGLAAIFFMLVIEGGMRWTEYLAQQEKTLAALRDEKQRLQAQAQDKAVLGEILQTLDDLQEKARKRIWRVHSEAVGQARQKDWLLAFCQDNNIHLHNLTLATPRAYDSKLDARQPDAPGIPARKKADLREFRATLSFSFSPKALEHMLAAIEGSDFFARVEGLSANRQQRRVEVEFVMLMEIDPSLAADHPETAMPDAASPDAKMAEIEAAVATVRAREQTAARSQP
jgi:hypothetical protein